MKKAVFSFSLYDFIDKKSNDIINENDKSIFTFFCWNINNPSLTRARNQAIWLRKQNSDIFVLTECKGSEGCNFLKTYFQNYGYHVSYSNPEKNEYGVMIVSRHKLTMSTFSNHIDYLQPRIISVKTDIFNNEIEIIGSYIPSRDVSPEKVTRKKLFIERLEQALEIEKKSTQRIFCGDFNVVEPNHIPHYKIFQSWEYNFYSNLAKYQLEDIYRRTNPDKLEYSWVGRTGDGYRYDHIFATSDIIPYVKKCYYYHEPREIKLSDHSALITIFNIGNNCPNKKL